MKLHTFILQNLEVLVEDWVTFARTLPACADLDVDGLKDHAEAMLRTIASDIATHQTSAAQLAKSQGLAIRETVGDTRAEVHGEERFEQGLGLPALVAEFRALRASVVRHWTARRGPPTTDMLDELVRFNEGIDQAIAESLDRYVHEVRRRDETEARRLREQEMRARRAEERLYLALKEAHMAYWELADAQHDRLTVSPTIQDLLGMRPGDALTSIAQGLCLLHPEDRPAHTARVAAAVKRREGWHCQFRIVRPLDGRVVWLEERAMPFADAKGDVSIMGLVMDVTERKAAEDARRRNTQTFADLIENAPFGVYVVDAALNIVQMNEGSRRSMFRNVDPAVGSELAEMLRRIWPEPAASECLGEFEHTLATGESYHSPRFVSRREDLGTTESYEWELHRIVLPDGQCGVVCYYFDLTQLLAAEEALREADRRKDQFLATLAHELRNPLAPIRQAAAIVRSPSAPPERVRWSMEVIDRQAAKMALLLDDLLDVSRITRGRLELQRRPVEAADIVRSAIETVAPLIDARQHALRVDLPTTPLVLDADPLRLSQVISNLLTNASRYSATGTEIRITVRPAGEQAEIVVSDRGIGIAADKLDAVFEMFGQGGAPAALREGGLGVGLALARGLVELHGGTLVARSEGLGRGAEFVVRLPLSERIAPASNVRSVEPPVLPTPTRVLVIDDNVDAADSLAQLLRLRGHDVHTAYGGEDGVACAERLRPDVVLLDLGMPGVDGYEAARRMRALDGGAAFTLVAVSGWGQAADRKRTEAAGIDYHLTKPLEESQLRPAFAEASKRHRRTG